MICIDQFTGRKTKEPLTTLAASLHGKLQFGIYLEKMTSEDDIDLADKNSINCNFSNSCLIRLGATLKCFKS